MSRPGPAGVRRLRHDRADVPELVEKAKRASGMHGNPIELTDEELTEIALPAPACHGASSEACVTASPTTTGQVDNDIVWAVVEQYAPQLHQGLAAEIDTACSLLDISGK